jgi:hypothetical protein
MKRHRRTNMNGFQEEGEKLERPNLDKGYISQQRENVEYKDIA